MEQSRHSSAQAVINKLSYQPASRAALRQTNSKAAEVWVTQFHNAIMDSMNVEVVSNDPEVRHIWPTTDVLGV